MWPLGYRVLPGVPLYPDFAARFVEQGLSLYVKRRRGRVESMQDDARRLARTMFVKSATVAHIRDLATKLYSLERLAGFIAKAFGQPI